MEASPSGLPGPEAVGLGSEDAFAAKAEAVEGAAAEEAENWSRTSIEDRRR